MDVFMTGASGWIGSAAVPELLAAGHRLRGIARSAAAADKLREAGVEPVDGDLDNLDVLRDEAVRAEAVLHLANKHDWSNPAELNRAERAAVQAFVTALEGTGKPFLFASGVALTPGRVLTEVDPNPSSGPDAPRGGAEALAMGYADRGVHAVSLRFAPTYRHRRPSPASGSAGCRPTPRSLRTSLPAPTPERGLRPPEPQCGPASWWTEKGTVPDCLTGAGYRRDPAPATLLGSTRPAGRPG